MDKSYKYILIVGLILILISLINAYPSFTTGKITSYLNEDQNPVFTYDFSSITNNTNAILPDTYSIININSSQYSSTDKSFYYWIKINSLTGILTLNSTKDNESGMFNISVQVLDTQSTGVAENFYFIVNATNDAPKFTGISPSYNLSYNLTQAQLFQEFINATDEESHYPLKFSINFTNCSLGNWSTRTNCTLLNFISFSNKSALMNYTPSRDDIGIYYANISIMDWGEHYNSSAYPYQDPNYPINMTTYYPSLITFNVLTNLGANIDDCENKIFQENQSGICYINITTKGENDTLNISSKSFLRNYAASIFNSSWFFSNSNFNSANFYKLITVNVTPEKTEIGNWTINFTIQDLTSSENLTTPIYVYVNRTLNDAPRLDTIPNISTSINLLTRINITSYDNDLLIPDKLQGYNETLNFSVNILNQSNLNQQLSINNFTIQIINMPVAGTNRTEAKIQFTPNSTSFGDYTINISVKDKQNSFDSKMFNLSIINDHAPNWSSSMQTTFVSYETNNTYLNLSKNITDIDGDKITFSFVNYTSFKSFNLNSSTGIINFTAKDEDVGEHIIDIIASDGYLSSVETLNFTIYNLDTPPKIIKPLVIYNGTIDSDSNINVSEDSLVDIELWIQDNDFKIPSDQKSFYNESLTINLTIGGPNSSLFSFIINPAFPTSGDNRSKYDASFTPKKNSVGNYSITINVTDSGGLSDILIFNLTVTEKQHNPVLENMTNKTTSINRNIYFNINATDVEDGNSWNSSNFTFSYHFLNGSDFIKHNQSIFNLTSGDFNMTFNNSQGGAYRINITVNDSTNRIDSKDFWIFVYDNILVIYPPDSYQFSLAENSTYNFTFELNHTMMDNLTYIILINNQTSLENSSFYGNGTNLSFQFTPNFLNETIGNLTLIAYPSNSNLDNKEQINITKNWDIRVNHTNYPLNLFNNINDIDGTSPEKIKLNEYFKDIDASDINHNQTITFTYNLSNETGGLISVSTIDWINGTAPSITFTTASDAIANCIITGYEHNESNLSQIINTVTSNNFSINLTVVTVNVPVPASGSGGGGSSSTTIPQAFKIISVGKMSAFINQEIKIPLMIQSTGGRSFNNINISALGFSITNKSSNNKIKISFDRYYLEKLDPGKSENITMTAFFETNETGEYEIIVNASSKSPIYSDQAGIYIDLQKINRSEVEKYLLFTEEFLVQNPNCLELKENLKDAQDYFDKGDYSNAMAKAENIVNSCKDYVSQVSLATYSIPYEYKFYLYFISTVSISIILGLLYYFYKRNRFQNSFNTKNSRVYTKI